MNDSAITQAAADWVVRLSADDPAERAAARDGFEAWKREHPQHAAVAATLESFLGQTRTLAEAGDGRSAARATVGQWMEEGARASTRQRRRRLQGALALAALIVLPAAVWLRAHPPDELLADLRTGTGQQRSVVLADGSRVTMASASAANVRLDPKQRRLNLMRGELLIDVAKDAARPFVVETAQGRIQALGTRFIVRTEGGHTWLTMIESRTAVRTATGERDVVVRPGERILLNGESLERLDDVSPGLVEDAFRQQRLLVQDRPLSEVLDELARHRPGVMRFDREALHALRVSAVLPLDDTDRALTLLSTQFPQLKVRTATRWVTWIDVRS